MGQSRPGDGMAQPERRMLLALLEDALDQLLVFGLAASKGTRSEAERWLFSNDRKPPFSFVNVCETLGLDPCWIRDKLVAQIEERNGKRRPSAKRAAGGDAG